MNFSTIKPFFSPWILVIIGISFNIFAAIISHHFISANNEQLQIIESKISAIDIRINTYWQNRQNIERKKEFILLYAQSAKKNDDNFIKQYIHSYISQLLIDYQIKHQPDIKLNDLQIITIIDQIKNIIVNDIDDIYLDRLLLEKQKYPINNNNVRLMSIALFLQMLGLILVLSKDLKK
ncbi:MAG: hypothetical protein QM479_00235 [Pseudomonadota bacterium]